MLLADIAIGDPLYAYANVHFGPTVIWRSDGADQQTVNFGATPFLGAIPAGATAWNGDGGTESLLGTLPLRDFISKIATYSGLDPALDLDFVGIDDVIHGGMITETPTFRDFLTCWPSLWVRLLRGRADPHRPPGHRPSYTVDKAIPPRRPDRRSDRAITTTRRKDEVPNEIELNYIDVTQQFRWNIQKARRILFPVKTTESKRKDSFAIPIITNANDALTMAGKAHVPRGGAERRP